MSFSENQFHDILVVSQMRSDSGTGVTTYYKLLVERMQTFGFRCTLVTPEHESRNTRIILKPVRLLSNLMPAKSAAKMWLSEFAYFASLYFSVRRIRTARPWSLIHAQDVSSSKAAQAALSHRVPALVTCHFNDTPVQERIGKFSLGKLQVRMLERWFRYLFRQTKSYMFVSRHSLNNSLGYINKSSATVVHNPGDFHKMKNIEGATNRKFRIINVGSLETRKNQILLIKAAYELKQSGVDIEINLYGNGPKKEEWKQWAETYGVSDLVIFHGYRRVILPELSQSDLLVHTASKENCSMAIIEAMSIGLPVLALATGGTPELFPPCRIGLLPPTCDSKSLSNEIQKCIQTNYRQDIASKQYEFGKNNLDFNIFVEKITSNYERYMVLTSNKGSLNKRTLSTPNIVSSRGQI